MQNSSKTSGYFSFEELITTDCNLKNIPSDMQHVENLVVLCDFLNLIRAEFGYAIKVNSGYRTPSVNRAVGGALHSLHMQGRAADIRPCKNPTLSKSKDEENLQKLIDVIELHRDELSEFIKYPTFVHIAI